MSADAATAALATCAESEHETVVRSYIHFEPDKYLSVHLETNGTDVGLAISSKGGGLLEKESDYLYVRHRAALSALVACLEQLQRDPVGRAILDAIGETHNAVA
jgi:hypothetical protein